MNMLGRTQFNFLIKFSFIIFRRVVPPLSHTSPRRGWNLAPRRLFCTSYYSIGQQSPFCVFHRNDNAPHTQVATTKGTGGDCIILEEAAYCDPGFFYETVAPLMLIGRTSLLAISTLTSEVATPWPCSSSPRRARPCTFCSRSSSSRGHKEPSRGGRLCSHSY